MESGKENTYWERLLGEEVARTINQEKNQEFCRKVIEQKETQLAELYQIFDKITERTVWKETQNCFDTFYQWFFSVALHYAEQYFPNLVAICEDADLILIRNIYLAIKIVPVRCLICDLHRCKGEGILKGDTSREEYLFYDSQMLGDIHYVKKFCRLYPEMLRLILLKIDWTVRELAYIAEMVKEDKEEIFCQGIPFFRIRKISCALSDTHRKGKTVAEVMLDNGVHFFYKPRSLQKEHAYQRVYEWFGQRLGMTVYHLKLIERKNYGWEENVEREACDSRREIEHYFYRMGIQLCLNYLINGSDLHGENIVAMGEYPVIIDMETCSARKAEKQKDLGTFTQKESAERERVYAFLRDSVLQTGILPVPAWNGQKTHGSGENMPIQDTNVSALHKGGKIMTPFRIPVVEHIGTSNIAISYRQGELELPDSIPYINETAVNPAEYGLELLRGFEDAYRCAMEYKVELESILSPVWKVESRYVPRHTQQYNMYLLTSFHPYFMKCTEDRIRFLHVLRKGKSEELSESKEQDIFWHELWDMLNMDIPYFSVRGDSVSLFASDGTETAHFFLSSALEEGKRKLAGLSEEDLRRQTMLISYSMLMLGKTENLIKNKKIQCTTVSNKTDDAVRVKRKERVQNAIMEIAQDIGKLMLDEDEGIWADVQFCGNGQWSIQLLSMNLYDGLPGVALFYAMLSKKMQDESYEKIFLQLCRKLFAYTDDRTDKTKKTGNMGMFVGESSVLYAYLLLWEIRKEPVFLEYAKKQEYVVKKCRDDTNETDLLAGDAGCILCYLKLYESIAKYEEMVENQMVCPVQIEFADKRRYLETAVEIGEQLWTRAEGQTIGYGWTPKGESVPLAGMAHGNSGGIYAYAALLEQTKNSIYIERIYELLKYENTLYLDMLGNWEDVRKQYACSKEKRNMVAWCHGAAGILLSRLKLYSLPEFGDDVLIKQDMKRALAALKYGEIPDDICLCHGLAGNYMIIGRYLKLFSDKELEERGEYFLQLLLYQLESENDRMTQERNRVGLMCGLTGAGIALCGACGGEKLRR